MAKNYTRFTDVEVTGELKVGSVVVDGVDDITAPTDAGDSYSKAQVQSLVDAVNNILAGMGKTYD